MSRNETKAPFDARDQRRSESVRERIRLRLPGAQREMFDAVMAWEDDMLAWCNDLAERLDLASEIIELVQKRRARFVALIRTDEEIRLDDLLARFAASNHEAVGAGSAETRATEAGVTPGEPSRVATDTRSGSGDLAATLALIGVVRDLGEIEADLRADVLKCCGGREQFCEAYGCSTIERIADRIRGARRAAMEATDD